VTENSVNNDDKVTGGNCVVNLRLLSNAPNSYVRCNDYSINTSTEFFENPQKVLV